ncbi:hypothetical protein CYMTET_6562 [Cymbomonas tetramitiformis]|uniref:Uncharacterized protein n=1 Tax=Cymbomonas tetramitiformis TaxID=36881 RepID=A0AAE0GXC8_9CHLO|nr:hypothetical protein CYMTET_6562 [Cymbomonas tetramitiformis]
MASPVDTWPLYTKLPSKQTTAWNCLGRAPITGLLGKDCGNDGRQHDVKWTYFSARRPDADWLEFTRIAPPKPAEPPPIPTVDARTTVFLGSYAHSTFVAPSGDEYEAL